MSIICSETMFYSCALKYAITSQTALARCISCHLSSNNFQSTDIHFFRSLPSIPSTITPSLVARSSLLHDYPSQTYSFTTVTMETDDADFLTEPYECNDPANEPRPDSVVYTDIFRDLQDLNKTAASLLRQPLEDSQFQSGITKGLIKEITKRTKEDFPDQVKFAIVGDMSAGKQVQILRCKNEADMLIGKSSLLNSILSIGTIARKVMLLLHQPTCTCTHTY